MVSAVDVSLKRICQCYWALSSYPRHSVIAPVDVLTALILERPQFGGALQQDVGDVLQLFQLGTVATMEFGDHASHFCVQGVTYAKLEADMLQKVQLPLQDLWDSIALEWDVLATLPSCLVIVYPCVYKVPEGGFRYSDLVLTDVDAPLRMGGRHSATYSLRAYIQHRHQGQPSRTSRSAGHYVAHFKNANVWFTADDTTTTIRREQGHMLPAVAFFELMADPTPEDWSVCDQGALTREPAWIHGVLEIVSALQVDGEWLLGLSEEEQLTVSQVVSAREAGAGLSESVLDDLYKLLAGGARGTASGAFDVPSSESDAITDEEEDAVLSGSSRPPRPSTATLPRPTPRTQQPQRTIESTLPGQLRLQRFFGVPERSGQQQDPSGQQQERQLSGQQQERSGRQQERFGR